MSVESYKTLGESKKAYNDDENKENNNARGHERGTHMKTTRQREKKKN